MLDKIISKQKAMFLGFLLLVIVVAEFAIETPGFPTWPAMMVMVLFFVNHRNPKAAPNILIGGAFGIFNIVIIRQWYKLTLPWFGGNTHEAMFHSKVIYILIFVSCIVLLMDVLSWIFNNYAFLYFIASGIAASTGTSNPFQWIAIEIIGGGLIILALIGVGKFIAKIMGAPTAASPPHHDA